KDAEFAVKTILDAMAKTLASGNRIEIRGFGSFALSYRPPRIGRNPKSGEKVLVPEKRVPHFKPGKQLRERVDAGREKSESGEELKVRDEELRDPSPFTFLGVSAKRPTHPPPRLRQNSGRRTCGASRGSRCVSSRGCSISRCSS